MRATMMMMIEAKRRQGGMQALWLYEGINGKLEQGNTARPHICAPQNYPIREIWCRLLQAFPPAGIPDPPPNPDERL